AAGTLVGLELGVAGIADLDRSLAPLDVELDRHFFDGNDFADQLGEIRHWAAELAGVDAEDSLLLLRRHLVVEVDGGAPVARENVARNVGDKDDRAAGDVDAVDRAFVEMPGNDGVAGAEIRIFADPARAQHATVAHFEQPSLKMISHVCLPDWSCTEFRRVAAAQGSSDVTPASLPFLGEYSTAL